MPVCFRQLATVEEDLSDAKADLEAAGKKADTLKKKAAKEKAAMEEEFEETKTQLEDQISSLKRQVLYTLS